MHREDKMPNIPIHNQQVRYCFVIQKCKRYSNCTIYCFFTQITVYWYILGGKKSGWETGQIRVIGSGVASRRLDETAPENQNIQVIPSNNNFCEYLYFNILNGSVNNKVNTFSPFSLSHSSPLSNDIIINTPPIRLLQYILVYLPFIAGLPLPNMMPQIIPPMEMPPPG